MLYTQLMKDVAFKKIENNQLFLESRASAPKNFIKTLQSFLEKVTKESWTIHLESGNDYLTLMEKRDLKRKNDQSAVQNHDLIQDILKTFPGSSLVFENE